MMKWYEDYEYASELYDAVQQHQQSFKNEYIHPESGTFKIKNSSIEFIYPKTFPNGRIWDTWHHTIYLRGNKI